MNETELTGDELADIKAREAHINRDIDRIKRDIAETAQRHGFDELTFTVEWKNYEPDSLPIVSCKGGLF